MQQSQPLSVARLSAIASAVASRLGDAFALPHLLIGGATAPALLDHLFAGAPLCMRDLDLFVVAGRTVERELAQHLGEAVDSPALRFLPHYVYPRRRWRGEAEPWIAGWGVLWDAAGLEVDVSIFHDRAALGLNGLLDVDRIVVPIAPAASLDEAAARLLATGSAEAARACGLVDDPWAGYAGWVRRDPAIVAFDAVHASPIECAIRIVRTCAGKLHLEQLARTLTAPLRTALEHGDDRGDRFLRLRNLFKLLGDDVAGVELEMLQGLGAFARWLPEIGEQVERRGRDGLAALFAAADGAAQSVPASGGGGGVGERRLEALLLAMPGGHRRRLREEIAGAEATLAASGRGEPRAAPLSRPRRRTHPSP